jgi:hypothetical protein
MSKTIKVSEKYIMEPSTSGRSTMKIIMHPSGINFLLSEEVKIVSKMWHTESFSERFKKMRLIPSSLVVLMLAVPSVPMTSSNNGTLQFM